MSYRRLLVALFAVLVIGQAAAQDQPDLDRLDEKFTRHLEKKCRGGRMSASNPSKAAGAF